MRRRDLIDYSQWVGGSRTARAIARTFNRFAGRSKLLAASRDEFPTGLAAFHFAAWDAYKDGDWEWAGDKVGGEEHWVSYVTFLDQSWYEDGLNR